MGCGAIGAVIAKHMAASDAVDELVVGDIDVTMAKRVADGTRSNKARALRIDVSDPEALRQAARGCGLVVNAVVPRFNLGIRAAALEAGTHYVDLATESIDPYTNHAEWRDAGLAGILGMGEDPGLSNVLARRAADGMDRLDSIRVRDGDTATSPEFPFIALFSPETFVEETLHGSRIWRDGRYEDVPPFGEREVYDFPAPVGPQAVYSVDHEEVDSLPRFLDKGVRYVDFKLAIDEATEKALREYQRLTAAGADAEAERARRAFFARIPKPADLAGRVDGFAALVVEVSGQKDGRPRTHLQYVLMGHREASQKHGATGTAYLTGTPAAVAGLLLLQGRVRARGLLAPEQLDPEPFLPMLEERGIQVHESVSAG